MTTRAKIDVSSPYITELYPVAVEQARFYVEHGLDPGGTDAWYCEPCANGACKHVRAVQAWLRKKDKA